MPVPALVRLPVAAELLRLRSLIVPLKAVELLSMPIVRLVAEPAAALPSTTLDMPAPLLESRPIAARRW